VAGRLVVATLAVSQAGMAEVDSVPGCGARMALTALAHVVVYRAAVTALTIGKSTVIQLEQRPALSTGVTLAALAREVFGRRSLSVTTLAVAQPCVIHADNLEAGAAVAAFTIRSKARLVGVDVAVPAGIWGSLVGAVGVTVQAVRCEVRALQKEWMVQRGYIGERDRARFNP
jgi:hypothetical protein